MGGADPAGGTPTWGAEGQPCFADQTNSCQHGDACRYKHAKISQEDYQTLKKRRGEALTHRKAKGTVSGNEGSGSGRYDLPIVEKDGRMPAAWFW